MWQNFHMYHTLLLARKKHKKRIFRLYNAAFVVPSHMFYPPWTTHEEFVRSFTERYKEKLHVIAPVNLLTVCKHTSPPVSPFYNLFSPYISTLESCCLCLEKQRRRVRKHDQPPSCTHGASPPSIRCVADKIAMANHCTSYNLKKIHIFKTENTYFQAIFFLW